MVQLMQEQTLQEACSIFNDWLINFGSFALALGINMFDSLWPAWKAAWALFLGQPSQKGFRALGKGLGEPVWDQKRSARFYFQ